MVGKITLNDNTQMPLLGLGTWKVILKFYVSLNKFTNEQSLLLLISLNLEK